jgi:uncharacterized membrane protein SirB2
VVTGDREPVPATAATLGGGMSREGLLPAVIATVGLWAGVALLVSFGQRYQDPRWTVRALFVCGLLCLVVAGVMTTRLARRADYPWLMFVAALAIPLYQPFNKPDTLLWRTVGAVYGLLLVLLAVYAFVRMVARTDELERRINQEALAFAFVLSLVLTLAYALLQDLLPPLQGLWVAAAMIATWLVGWNLAARRYR